MWKKSLVLIILCLTPLLFSGCIEQFDKRRFAGLQVSTNDIAATLYLNDEYISDTPFKKKDLQPGSYTLKIVPEDPEYVSYELPIKLTSGLLTAVIWKPGDRNETSGGVVFELERISNRQMTELTIKSIPDGAIVRVNNGEMEFAPTLQSELTPGKHDLQVSLPSYVEQHHTLNLVAGHRLAVLVKLARAQDSLEAAQDLTLDEDNEIIQNTESTQSADLQPAKTQTNNAQPAQTQTNNSQAATNSASPTTGPTPIRTAKPQGAAGTQTQSIKINSTGFFNNGSEVLRVRSGPGSSFAEIGFAPVGNTYPYLNETQNGWLKIQFNSQTGWVSESHATIE
jgi:hypothetical protein